MNKRRPLSAIGVLFLIVTCLTPAAGAQSGTPPPLTEEQVAVKNWRSEPVPNYELIKQLPAGEGTVAPDEPGADRTVDPGVGMWSRIAYQSYWDGNWEVLLASGGTGNGVGVRLTFDGASDVDPHLTRPTGRLSFSSNRTGNYEIYTAKDDGTGLQNVSNHPASDREAVWSPDGRRLAFTSNRESQYAVYVMNADGSGQRRVTYPDAAHHDVSPTWSPDGTMLAWVRSIGSYGSMWIANADGGNAHALTDDLLYGENVTWSRDGTTLAFDFDSDGDYLTELATIRVDGTGLRTNLLQPQSYADEWNGGWSPDGSHFVYTCVAYIVAYGQLYIKSARINMAPVGTRMAPDGNVSRLQYDMMPDWQSMDVEPPVTRMTELPAFSRANLPITVEWSASDNLSGVASSNAQVSVNHCDWTPFSEQYLRGLPGYIYTVRARSIDQAANQEDWPTSGAETTFFTWRLRGAATDVRGFPLANATPAINPAPIGQPKTGAEGVYFARAVSEGEMTVGVTKPGYSAPPDASLDLRADSSLLHVFSLPDNIVQNGGFEAGTTAPWIATGVPPPVLTTTLRNSGQGAMVFGQSMMLEAPQSIGWGSHGDLAVDTAGTVHLVGLGPGDTLRYATLMPDGTWSAPADLSIPGEPGYKGGSSFLIVPDEAGGIYLLWLTGSYLAKDAWISHKPAGGVNCSPAEKLAQGRFDTRSIDAVVDRANVLHVIGQIYRGGLWYARRFPTGEWQPTQQIVDQWIYNFSLAADPIDGVHLAWTEADAYALRYARTLPLGVWTTPQLVSQDWYVSSLKLGVGPDGIVQLAWTDFGLRHSSYIPGEGWTEPFTVQHATPYDPHQTVYALDRAGAFHVVYAGNYFVGSPGNEWRTIGSAGMQAVHSIAVDHEGHDHMVGTIDNGGSVAVFHRRTATSMGGSGGQISQQVTIPVEMHQPTLSFAKTSDLAWLPNQVYAQVNGVDVTVNEVMPADGTVAWTLGWVDMSRWAGQTVTVTLGQKTGGNIPQMQLALDDISLGSWETPVIEGVSPLQIEAGTPQSIVITGTNFITTPLVYVGSVAASQVEMISETELRAEVTAPPGFAALRVVNPGGQDAVFATDMHVGRFAYLPIARR